MSQMLVSYSVSCLLAGLFITTGALAGADSRPASPPLPSLDELRVREFGTISSQPRERGFVFLDAKYVKPPYVVARKGSGIFVNDELIEWRIVPPDATLSAAGRTLGRLDARREEYAQGLAEDKCCFSFRSGKSLKLDAYVVAYRLPWILKKIRSSRPEEYKLSFLNKAGWQYALGKDELRTLVRTFEAPAEFDKRVRELAVTLLRVEDFGTTAGAPVSAGFVFVGGRYVDAPYTVTRKGLGLFINDTLIEEPARWPLPSPPPFAGQEDPAVPSAIGKDTNKHDPVLTKYLAAKGAYLAKHHPRDEAIRLMGEVYASLPCVKEAHFDPLTPIEKTLIVTWSDGQTHRIRMVPPERKAKDDAQSILADAERRMRNYEERLQKGDYYYFSKEGGHMSGGAAAAKEILPKVVAVLRSQEPADVKFEKIQQAGFRAVNKDSFADLVTEFSASAQLDERLAELASPGR